MIGEQAKADILRIVELAEPDGVSEEEITKVIEFIEETELYQTMVDLFRKGLIRIRWVDGEIQSSMVSPLYPQCHVD